MRTWISILCYCFALALLSAQDLPPRQVDPSILAEELFAQQELDLNFEEVYESVLQYLASPIDLNRASAEELRSLFVLNDRQIADLLEYRSGNGSLLSLYELQSIGSFDPDLIRRLSPFVSFGTVHSNGGLIRRILKEPNSYLLLRYEHLLESKEGFHPTQDSAHRFLGSPGKYFARFRVSHPGDFSIGFTAEKDPGEVSITDYYSFHFQRSGGKRLINFIAGDFQAFFGQGLVMGGGFGMGKGAETILTMRRNTLGFIPWTSSSETGFFRGAGITIAPAKNFRIHTFASLTIQDAILRQDSLTDRHTLSLLTTGLHRNTIETSRRKVLQENNGGVVLEYRTRSLQLGATSLHTSWPAELLNTLTVYNHLELRGASCTNVGAFINYTVKNFNLFGEAAKTIGWGTGMVGGALISLSRSADLALVVRHYSTDFWSPYGSAISENSSARNEAGVYWGWKVQATKRIGFAGYVDVFHFPWMQYRIYAPASSGHDAFIRMNWRPRKEVTLIAQVREERKERNSSNEGPVYHTATAIKRNYCLGVDFGPAPISLRTRIQGSTLKMNSRTAGIAVIQDIRYDARHWSLQLRQALFGTDDFDNRQYTYEPDMWMAYSFPAYYGSGVRTTAMLRVGLGRHADFWLRWARIRFEDRASTGSGLDTVKGPARNDLKVQLRLKL